jgi:hypothetical protein
MGTEEIKINRRAGAEARAKKASEVADHMEVASVLKPIGLSIRVAGSSFMVVKKMMTAPARTPDRTSGRVMVTKTCRDLRPRPRATSSRCGVI